MKQQLAVLGTRSFTRRGGDKRRAVYRSRPVALTIAIVGALVATAPSASAFTSKGRITISQSGQATKTNMGGNGVYDHCDNISELMRLSSSLPYTITVSAQFGRCSGRLGPVIFNQTLLIKKTSATGNAVIDCNHFGEEIGIITVNAAGSGSKTLAGSTLDIATTVLCVTTQSGSSGNWMQVIVNAGSEDLVEANGNSLVPDVSADGRLVAFTSSASNLVTDDTNLSYDVYVRDAGTSSTSRVSVASGGAQGNDHSHDADISATGRYVAFDSVATNLVGSDSNARSDIFVRDRTSGTTERVSVRTNSVQATGHSTKASISSDGRYVAFLSDATNLVDSDTNGKADIFVHDRSTASTSRVSVASGGAQANDASDAPAISADGRYVAFASLASNLVEGDQPGTRDIFVYDRNTSTTARASIDVDGTAFGGAEPSISADGRFVAFATEGGRILVRDLATSSTVIASVDSSGELPDGPSSSPSISADGRYVAFSSTATNLFSLDDNNRSDIFERDIEGGITRIVSIDDEHGPGNADSYTPSISADSTRVVFSSSATNFGAGRFDYTSPVEDPDHPGGKYACIIGNFSPEDLEFITGAVGRPPDFVAPDGSEACWSNMTEEEAQRFQQASFSRGGRLSLSPTGDYNFVRDVFEHGWLSTDRGHCTVGRVSVR